MIGSDNIKKTDPGAFAQAGVGHHAAYRCIRCPNVVGNSSARHNWRGVKQARFCAVCDAWWQERQEAKAA